MHCSTTPRREQTRRQDGDPALGTRGTRLRNMARRAGVRCQDARARRLETRLGEQCATAASQPDRNVRCQAEATERGEGSVKRPVSVNTSVSVLTSRLSEAVCQPQSYDLIRLTHVDSCSNKMRELAKADSSHTTRTQPAHVLCTASLSPPT